MKRKSKRTALETALNFLGFRARSEKEIRDRLSKAFPDIEIDQAVKRLKDWKFIDDSDFTKSYVESRSRSKPRSRRLLKLELLKKGIRVDVDALETEPEEVLASQALIAKKNIKTFAQAVRFLQARGFAWSTIEKVLKNRYNTEDVNSNS